MRGTQHGSRETSARWTAVFSQIPVHDEAPSTRYYQECERQVFETFVGPLAGKRVLKTDLWDEAKNTRILVWAAQQGCKAYGIDIAPGVVREAGKAFRDAGAASGFTLADVREIPFADGSFDVVYSMGTIEHFPETQQAVEEIFRVLRPGGVAIIGVPNKLDPFLRPLMVTVLDWFGRYPYGPEKSYTAGQLAKMAQAAGFRVTAMTGLLFIPGALRIMDLLLHAAWRPLGALSGLLVAPFALAYRRLPAVRRHGYLIACIARKPG